MGLRIKEVIKEKGMTVQTLAEKMGINRVGLSNHINGNPSVAILEKIAAALEVPIQELFEKKHEENINGYIEIGNEIFKITSLQDVKNIINRFDGSIL
ncbi:helix-turn-helix domain-containing protein [Bacteroides caecimuris]|uniref:helix-turn-helix domain-containing protein n=1 Tax=Bacteroides caecimuris TaxID=1796613 RepID=UPI00138F6A16|nr:helix-turn-helix transcriptional regulator [Bacteroides caecimuris]NDO58369.1 helix-turn-helix transcriptional regulator [Bacteroides caecimuris]